MITFAIDDCELQLVDQSVMTHVRLPVAGNWFFFENV